MLLRHRNKTETGESERVLADKPLDKANEKFSFKCLYNWTVLLKAAFSYRILRIQLEWHITL